jgi:peroxiredoxin
MNSKSVILKVCLLVFSISGLFAQVTNAPRVLQETSRKAELIAKEYPYDIELKDADGQIVNSAKVFSKRKKATVLLFWMTTCGPCRMELNAISSKFNQWKKKVDFDFYAISTDFPDRVEQFNNRVKESNWPFPAYFDFNREFRFVMPGELNGLPQLFVLDKKGKIVYHTRRYLFGDEDKLFDALKAI